MDTLAQTGRCRRRANSRLHRPLLRQSPGICSRSLTIRQLSLMLKGEKVILRAIERDDLERLHTINNNLAVELAGGGDPPMPQSMARLMAEDDSNASHGGGDDAGFAIEVDGMLIGVCALFAFDNTAHTFELGITIGYPEFWGRGYGREAIQILVNYGFHYRNAHKIWLRVHGVNERGQ